MEYKIREEKLIFERSSSFDARLEKRLVEKVINDDALKFEHVKTCNLKNVTIKLHCHRCTCFIELEHLLQNRNLYNDILRGLPSGTFAVMTST